MYLRAIESHFTLTVKSNWLYFWTQSRVAILGLSINGFSNLSEGMKSTNFNIILMNFCWLSFKIEGFHWTYPTQTNGATDLDALDTYHIDKGDIIFFLNPFIISPSLILLSEIIGPEKISIWKRIESLRWVFHSDRWKTDYQEIAGVQPAASISSTVIWRWMWNFIVCQVKFNGISKLLVQDFTTRWLLLKIKLI